MLVWGRALKHTIINYMICFCGPQFQARLPWVGLSSTKREDLNWTSHNIVTAEHSCDSQMGLRSHTIYFHHRPPSLCNATSFSQISHYLLEGHTRELLKIIHHAMQVVYTNVAYWKVILHEINAVIVPDGSKYLVLFWSKSLQMWDSSLPDRFLSESYESKGT